MNFYHVVAMSQNKVIGKDNALPWHYSSDLKHFKVLTTGHAIVMGRKTYESIGRPLPNRQNIVLSRSDRDYGEQVEVFSSLQDAKKSIQGEQAFIIGGANLYEQTLADIQGIHLTLIHKDYDGDAYYPGVPEGFIEKERKALQEEDPLIEVIYYERKLT